MHDFFKILDLFILFFLVSLIFFMKIIERQFVQFLQLESVLEQSKE